MGGPPKHLRVSADLKQAFAEVAALVRAGEHTDEELIELESQFTELAEASDFSDKTPDGARDRQMLTMLAASKAAAKDVLQAITDFRNEIADCLALRIDTESCQVGRNGYSSAKPRSERIGMRLLRGENSTFVRGSTAGLALFAALAIGLTVTVHSQAKPSGATITGGSGTVSPGSRAFLDAKVHAKWCLIEASRGKRSEAGSAQKVRSKQVRVLWTVPKKSASGTYTLSLRCGRSKETVRTSTANLKLVVRGGQGKKFAVPVKHLRIVSFRAHHGSEQFNVDGLPEGKGNPDDYSVALPPGVGGGGYGTYWPLSQGTKVIITEGPGGGYSHNTVYTQNAVDLGVPSGTQVRAGFYGVVARINTGCAVGNLSCGSGYGNYVYLKSSDGTCAIFGHLSQISVALGQQLKTYDAIGLSGNTGHSSGPHLHYDRVNCSNNQSMPWAPIEGGSLREGSTVISQNHLGGDNPGGGSTNLHGEGWQTAFNAGSLWSIGFDVRGSLGLGVAPGTSPSITVLSNGSWEAAFQATNGSLWVVGPTDVKGDMHLGMAPGTSPSITALKGGGWEVAFQAPNNHLWTVGNDDRGDMGLGMSPGTSPSITGLDNGSWEVAFNAGPLWVVGPTDVRGDMHLGMAPGTSPSITGLSGGGWQAAFHAPGDRLWSVGNDDRGDMSLGIAPGTSPSITGLGNGSWEIAWNAGGLWVVGPTDVKGDMHLGIDSGTNPSITAIGQNGWEVAWNAGGLWLTGNDVRGNMGLGMAAGTSPSISS